MTARSSRTSRRTSFRPARTSSGSSDITYVALPTRFVYVAVILDAWSRLIVGYAIGRSIDARLTVAALKAAIERRKPPAGCIHHSDSQYAAAGYRKVLGAAGMIQSMSRKGNCWDCESVGALGWPDPCCD